jgi:carboxyl-terminal processing protease
LAASGHTLSFMRARWFFLGLMVGGAFVGAASGVVPARASGAGIDAGYRKLRIFSQVLTYVQQSYVDDVDPEALIYDAINGLLAHLDPHTTFLRPAEYEKLREDTAGEFGGLGLEVGVTGPGEDATVVIEGVHEDGPGAHAGLKRGDLIVGVDGESTIGAPLEHSVRLMRGVPGTRVVLTVTRSTWSKPRDVPLVRQQVRMPSVEADTLDVEGGIVGYLSIASFQDRTDQEVAEAVASIRRTADERGRKFGGLVLDLRDNPGGLFDEGVKVADRFLQGGVIVSTVGRGARAAERSVAHVEGTEPPYPIAVLVNGNTASASEIVAAALQDHGRAVVVGERSFGKGSVQSLFGLEDGAGLKLTVARYLTPNGRSLQGTGVVPDVVVRTGPRGPEPADATSKPTPDPQLAAALAALRGVVRPAPHSKGD